MNATLIAYFIGWLLIGLGVIELVPVLAALLFGEPALPYVASAVVALAFGIPIVATMHPSDRRMRRRDGFLAVSLAWVFSSLLGSLPYDLTDTLGPVDALFESVAGFTTTGSSALTRIETAPKALLLWRSITQWLGGMGMIVFAIALMPLLGVGGMQLFKAEVPGPVADKLTPRVAATARRLWLIYVGLTAAQWILLVAAGLDGYEALCHALTTVSTGGFSTRDASIASFDSALVEWIVIVFMLLAGINFVLHYRVLTGRAKDALRDAEFRYYVVLLLVATLVVTWLVSGADPEGDAPLRTSLFQVVSISTTTGYATADFESWPSLALLVLLQLMVLGGMAGSTSGGIKGLRTLIGLRALREVLGKLGHPHAVRHPVTYGRRRVPADVLSGVWAFLTVYFVLAACVTAVVCASGYDLVTAASAALTSIGNVGPGLGEIGPLDNFAHFPSGVKLTLAAAMIVGRLELFTVLILFHPAFWRR